MSEAGAVFSYDGSTVTDNGAGDEDPTIGEVCVSGLLPGDYDVTETSAPPGYGLPTDPGPETVTVVAGTNCDAQPANRGCCGDVHRSAARGHPGELPRRWLWRDQRDVDRPATNTGTTADTTPATGWDDSVTHEDIRIDPSPRTIICTIVIDP